MVDLFGYLGGIFLMISFLPQLAKSIRTRSMGDLSYGMLIATSISGIFYQIYAYYLGLVPVLVMNGVFMASVLTALFLKFRYEREGALVEE